LRASGQLPVGSPIEEMYYQFVKLHCQLPTAYCQLFVI
jgi:hypothetical protein